MSHTSDSAPVPRRHRWWIPAGILTLAAALALFVFLSPAVDDGLRSPFATLLGGVITALLNVWWLAFSGFPWRSRGIGILVQLAVLIGWNGLVRVDGWTGDMYPILAWRWSPVPEQRAASQSLPVSPSESVVLDIGPDDFPRFLGPDGTGSVTGRGLDPDWATHPPKELWRKPVGLGWSAFATAGGYAVTQEQLGPDEVVTCRRIETGDVVWSHRDAGRFSEWIGGDGPRATPTIDGGDVYVMAAIGLLHRLDGITGRPRWTRDILKEHNAANQQWAKSCSPLIVGNRVVVTLGETKGTPTLAAYDRDSGKRVWTAGTDKPAYGTPVLADVAGRRQLLVCNFHTVAGHDPDTGKTLWSFAIPGDMSKCSNAIALPGDRVFTSAGYGVGAVFIKVSPGASGLEATDDGSNPRILRTRFTNAVVFDHYLFGLDDGVLQCVDATTGKSRWRKGRYGQGQVLRVDELLIVQAEQGDVVLVAADPTQHRELGRIPALHARTWNNPALAGKRLLVRNAEEAACYELP